MTDLEPSDLLMDLYDCPTNRDKWPVVLDQVCRSVGARCAAVQWLARGNDRASIEWAATDSGDGGPGCKRRVSARSGFWLSLATASRRWSGAKWAYRNDIATELWPRRFRTVSSERLEALKGEWRGFYSIRISSASSCFVVLFK